MSGLNKNKSSFHLETELTDSKRPSTHFLFWWILLAFVITGAGAFYSNEPQNSATSLKVPVPTKNFRELIPEIQPSKRRTKVARLAEVEPQITSEKGKRLGNWFKKRPKYKSPKSETETLTTYAVEGVEEQIPSRRTVAKQIALRDLPISPELMDRIEDDQKKLGAIAIGNYGGSTTPTSNSRVSVSTTNSTTLAVVSESGPYGHNLQNFIPGTSDNGSKIEEVPEDEEEMETWLRTLNGKISGAPDYSIESEIPQLNHLLSFGHEGEVILEIVGDGLTDGEGVDFIVFENPFVHTDAEGAVQIYAETARIAVSETLDPESFKEFPCDVTTPPFTGCAGITPVSFREDLPIQEVGGDHYDLADVGAERIKYIRIQDTGDNASFAVGTEGFDLDAVALVY